MSAKIISFHSREVLNPAEFFTDGYAAARECDRLENEILRLKELCDVGFDPRIDELAATLNRIIDNARVQPTEWHVAYKGTMYDSES
jgi:hypothetical protein